MYSIQLVDWTSAASQIKEVREKVFVIEQRLDWSLVEDSYDTDSLHVLALSAEGNSIGCGRIKPSGHLGRLAVLLPWRHVGVGSQIVQTLVGVAGQANFNELHLHSTLNLMNYFSRFQFVPNGPVFMEWGRPTQRMIRPLVSPHVTVAQRQFAGTTR
ncbi:MAG: GNAT family N-acetyltransferase [Gammaproteobacteria bacterium]|nr:MAG: GNAT family N-acetyltransferase [Gammaproteobacteria bacterium]